MHTFMRMRQGDPGLCPCIVCIARSPTSVTLMAMRFGTVWYELVCMCHTLVLHG